MKTLLEYLNESIFDKDLIEKNHINTTPSTKAELLDVMGQYVKLARPKKNEPIDFNWIDVSKLDELPQFFEATILRPYNLDVSKWDVSNVKNFTGAFKKMINFDCDLSGWDVSSATHMGWMFESCKSFTGKGVDKWNVPKNCFTTGMFKKTKMSESNLPSWADKWTLK